MKYLRTDMLTAMPLILSSIFLSQAAAETGTPPSVAPSSDQTATNKASTSDAGSKKEAPITFEADNLVYDHDNDIVTVNGKVHAVQNETRLSADELQWDRKADKVTATGHVIIIQEDGTISYSDKADLDPHLKDGVIQNILLVMQNGSRMAANKATRVNDVTTLDMAAYTPCRVINDEGCPKTPLWRISAVKIIRDPNKEKVVFKSPRLDVLGHTILKLPNFSYPDQNSTMSSGLLIPHIQRSKMNGFEFSVPYYFRLAPDRDLTLTPYIFTKADPGLGAKYRQLFSKGFFQIEGMLTRSTPLPAESQNPTLADSNAHSKMRGYINTNGKFQIDPKWSLTGSIRLTTDKTFLRRYDFAWDDRLRSTLNLERITDNSYFSVAGWVIQGLRPTDHSGTQPMALPIIDWRMRMPDPWLGGEFSFQANSMNLTRITGQDTQRAFASAEWNLRKYTPLGQRVTFTALLRQDLYHSSGNALTSELYRGSSGWQQRGIAAGAVDVSWPFAGEAFGGNQVLTPRVQIVTSPHVRNLSIPDEDSRSIDLQDTNLFSINRFPGYDRWEDGTRVTYGGEYTFHRPMFSFYGNVGQSMRIITEDEIFPQGTGFNRHFSDYVGRATLSYGSFFKLTERIRLDRKTLAIRRQEVNATIGSKRTYLMVGYLQLSRDIDTQLEPDLGNYRELRLGGRIQISHYWSIFGSTTVDMTTKKDQRANQQQADLYNNTNSSLLSDGFQPVRHRLGIEYDDNCLTLGVTWRRDYSTVGDSRRGNSFMLRFALKNMNS
ncbi:LPS-assembly protein [Zymomonas mobilis]|uniref:LPS-assembly protein LptD n=1 Tax=Zymomonas mobilis TaxID=542 RepID=UPI000B3ABB0A|nr:LPS assembly protein LptD [Zymomonas mobilis]ART94184.1 organic solvent tolerance protein [Zymomonas mobilis subsp. mobilis]TWD60942.1 LPS-assembly protein [Zymomonas mobilis]